MTNDERNLILKRLIDKGLLPNDGEELDPATVLSLTPREMEVLRDMLIIEAEFAKDNFERVSKLAPPNTPRWDRFKAWLWFRWLSMRLFFAKLRAK